MMALVRLIYMLKIVITFTVISYNSVLCVEGKERSASEVTEPDIFSTFNIKEFNARVMTNSTILVTWNLIPANKARGIQRNLHIFQNGTETHQIPIVMKDQCKVNQVLSPQSATCNYNHTIENCMNYKFVLGRQRNSANVTIGNINSPDSFVPIVQGSALLELTHDEENPVKLSWKIDCNSTHHRSPVSVSFFGENSQISFMVDAVCNSTEKNCEAHLGKAQLPCIPHAIDINQERATLNVETYYAHVMQSLSVKLDNADIRVEWNEPIICQFGSSNIDAVYTLVVFETDTQQVAINISIPFWCIEGTSRRRLIFHKNNINVCYGSRETSQLQSTLKSCTNYSVNVVHPENRYSASLESLKLTSFILQSLKPAEIRNLEIAGVSSNGFEVKWEIPVGCQKVKDLVIPIKINHQWPISIRLSDANTVCNESTCVVNWDSHTDITPCTLYVVQVGIATVNVITRPPGVAMFNAPTNALSDGYSVDWHVPSDCLNLLAIPQGRSLDRPNVTQNCVEKSCHMLWHFQEKLDPCTTKTVLLGLFPVIFTTLPGVADGVATNVIISSEKQSSSDERDTAVVSWNRPVCENSQILGWQILIKRVQSNKEVVTNISNLISRFEFDVKPCEIYHIAIRTQYEDDNDRYFTSWKSFEANCPVRFLVPLSAIAILLVVAIIVALFFLKMQRRRETIKDQTELNNIRTSTTENRSRIPSISRNRLSSFNRNRISSNSWRSSNGDAENHFDILPQMAQQPLTVRDLCSFETGQARMEFFLINKLTEIEAKRMARVMAERPENKIKNRFLNTHPYDFNRVILSHSEDHQNDSYINASFIPGFNHAENEYIAAQGPKDNTVGDFWRLIWEQEVKLVAMVTSLHECGKKKCEKYWPNKGDSVAYGDFQLELLNESVNTFYTARNILISKSPELCREIQQFHFTAWPDFEIPEQPEQLIRFIEIVRREAKQLKFPSPIVVHCSAGVGRTGTFIALDYLIQQVLISDVVDVPKTVRHLRRFRLSMVQSEAQYVFLYTCIAHYVKTRLAPTAVRT